MWILTYSTHIPSSITQTVFQCQTDLVQMLIDVNIVRSLWFHHKILLACFFLLLLLLLLLLPVLVYGLFRLYIFR